MCVCSLNYPARKVRAPFCIVICGLSGTAKLFPHYLVNGTIFEKTLLNPKGLFWFPQQVLSETILTLTF